MFPRVRELLLADSVVVAQLTGGIWPHGTAPQNVALPYLTYAVLGGNPENNLDGTPPCDNYSTLVRVWTASADGREGFDIGELVRDCLEASHYMESVPTSGQDEETKRYFVGMLFHFIEDRVPRSSSSS